MVKKSKPHSKYLVIFAIVFIFIIVIASLVANAKTNLLSQASLQSGFRNGCYFRLDCPPRNRGSRPVFHCAPILVCPTPTEYPPTTVSPSVLTCKDCVATGNTALCFDPGAQASYCASSIIVDSNVSCISCDAPLPTCKPWPTCPPGAACAPFDPGGGWCPPPNLTLTPSSGCHWETICDPAYPTEGCRPKQIQVCPTPPSEICLQVFTWGRNQITGECKLFPTSCLPPDWTADQSCKPVPTGSANCTYRGKTYKSGERFPATDGCNSCSCDKGRIACTTIAC